MRTQRTGTRTPKRRTSKRRPQPPITFKSASLDSLLLPQLTFLTPQLPAQTIQPAPQQTGSLLDDLIKFAVELGWATFKAEWGRVSPDSRKAWDVGAAWATSPDVTPSGQKAGVVLCSLSLVAGLDAIEKAAEA